MQQAGGVNQFDRGRCVHERVVGNVVGTADSERHARAQHFTAGNDRRVFVDDESEAG